MNGTVQDMHPYAPFGITMPGYAPNTMASPALVASFAAGSAVILTTAFTIIQRHRPGLPTGQMATALWFVLCGCIHFFFEGYFAYNFASMPTKTDIFGQLWKEYSLSDSRYLTADSFVVCMEAITAIFWGPLSFLCAWCVVYDAPLRHPLQIIVSLGQLYGDVLYYATCTFAALVEKVHFCRPEDFYFWAYYVFCNAFWIVIPFVLIVSSVKATVRVFAQVQKAETGKKKQ